MDDPPLGLIAGTGRLPILTAQGMRAVGRRVVAVGLRGQFDPDLPALCDRFNTAGIAQLGRWIRLLRRSGVRQAVLVGAVDKRRMYGGPLAYFQCMPDWRAARLWYRKLRNDRRTDAMLRALVGEIESTGINLVGAADYIPDMLAGAGVMTRARPSAGQMADIAFAMPILRHLGQVDIGQSIAVRDREVIAIEAIEGTAATIARAGELCPTGKWVLVKLAKPNQDMRVDAPTIGVQTIRQLADARAGCLAVEAGKVILLDKPQLLAEADRLGIAIIGIR